MSKDYYQILGIPRTANRDEIKKAYKQLAKKYHPDLNKSPDATEKFKEINEAASVLADDQKRTQYDQFGDADTYRKAAGSSGFGSSDFNDYSSFDFDDIFERIFGGSFGFSNRRQPARGHDLLYQLQLTLEEAFEGVKKDIRVPRLEKCEACKGKGAKDGSSAKACTTCKGSGV